MSNNTHHTPPTSPSPQYAFEHRKHAALKDRRTPLTPEQWFNVNQAIKKTVDAVLAKNYELDGLGPGEWELDVELGVSLVAEVRYRPLKKQCSLNDPKLKAKLRKMARDVTHGEFRHTYDGGKVWFFFRLVDPDIVAQFPVEEEHPIEDVQDGMAQVEEAQVKEAQDVKHRYSGQDEDAQTDSDTEAAGIA
ncbi:Uu.00g112280.m01.CDS01 [Anthostomella pinea]|uniref:Uu.00g112280.m01.CDS01 n=1 Tax=Anthostomella pinea TaxID=933095 RepID=A0AAI8VGB0_9PEZI|nr:Uu.00g112280.m01.CDS01 [Anthostomella pinea]